MGGGWWWERVFGELKIFEEDCLSFRLEVGSRRIGVGELDLENEIGVRLGNVMYVDGFWYFLSKI